MTGVQFTEVHEALAGHVAILIRHGSAAASKALKNFTPCGVELPDISNFDKKNVIKQMILQENYKAALKDWMDWEENKVKIYNFYFSHTEPLLKTNLTALEDWEATKTDKDGVELATLLVVLLVALAN